jgi:hypothetical protein
MKRASPSFLLFTLIAALTLNPLRAVLAKGPPYKVTISGPGIQGRIVVTDPQLLDAFAIYGFNDLERRIDPPQVELGGGYRITRYADEETAWDYLTYYLNPAGGLGYLFFDGLDPSIGTTQGQGMWYLPSEDGDAAMKRILADYRASYYPPKPAAPAGGACAW